MNIVLLHGSNGSPSELVRLAYAINIADSLANVFLPTLLGHGKRDVPTELTMESLALDVLAQMDDNAIEQAHVAGYSFGGLLSLYMVKHYPTRVLCASAIITKAIYDTAYASTTNFLFTRLLDPVANKPPQVARRQVLAQLHGENWKELVLCNQALTSSLEHTPALSQEELNSIQQPVLVVGTEKDQLVSPQEARWLAESMPNGVLKLYPGQGHPFESLPLIQIAQDLTSLVYD